MSKYTIITSGKSKKTALLLCALGGFFGLHYFYVGRVGKGIIYFFTCGFMIIGMIYDLITIVSGNFKDSSGTPLRK